MTPQEIAYIVFGVILIATFISIFFFTYVSKVEGDIVKIQMDRIVTDLTSDSDLVLSADQKKNIGAFIHNNLKMPDMSDADSKVTIANDLLKKKAMKLFGTIVAIGMCAIFFIYMKYGLDFKEIFKYSIVTLLFVALTEYIFVTAITKNYIIVDPNYVRYLILNNFRTYAKNG